MTKTKDAPECLSGWRESKAFLSIPEFMEVTGIRRTLAYDLVRRGEVPSRKVGGRRLIPVVALREWLGEVER